MESSGTKGRIIGILLLSQLIGGILVNFILAAPLFNSPGFLINGALYSKQIGFSVLLGLMISGVAVAIAITAFPVFNKFSNAMALWFLSLSVVSLSASVVEQISMMSLVSFSMEYSGADAATREQMELIRIVVASARNWAHYIGLLISGTTIFLMYLTLYRFRLVPRLLSVFGLVATVSQLTGVSMPLIGWKLEFLMLAPLALSQIALGAWLAARGFSTGESGV
jgi:uncharacterized protein DUF4386